MWARTATPAAYDVGMNSIPDRFRSLVIPPGARRQSHASSAHQGDDKSLHLEELRAALADRASSSEVTERQAPPNVYGIGFDEEATIGVDEVIGYREIRGKVATRVAASCMPTPALPRLP